MPTISNLSFNVRFDLTGTPTLVLTDTTTAPPAGLVGIFSITQPDGYTRTGDISTPDISVAGGSFSVPLRLDSTGGLQCGTYRIAYTGNAPSYLSTDFTREFVFTYQAPELILTEDFDVFTPLLRYIDSSTYTKSGYTNSAITRAWTAVSIPTGTITGSSATFDMVFGGEYYDANYNVGLTSSLLYTNTTYNWLTVQETVTKSVSTYAETPPSITTIIGEISDLKLKLDQAINTCQVYDGIKADFEYAQTLFQHIFDKIRFADMDNIYEDLKELLTILNNYQIPVYTATNLPIQPYDISGINYPVTRSSQTFTATAGQTVFTTTYPFQNNLFDLFLNGVKLNISSYNTLGEYQITLVDGCSVGDIVDVVIYDPTASIITNPVTSWGTIIGTLSTQTDLQTALNGKFNNPTGTISQYLRGDGSLATLPNTSWGNITGTLSNQTDLQNALNAKQNALTNPITGTGTAGQVAYFTGATTQAGSNNLFWDATNSRLGIGTATPLTKVHIRTGSASSTLEGLRLANGSNDPNAGNRLSFFFSDGASNIGGAFIDVVKNGSDGNMILSTSALNGTPTEKVRIFGDGNVGINTGSTNSGQRLQVTGDTLLKGSGATSATNGLIVQDSAGVNIYTFRNDGQAISSIRNAQTEASLRFTQVLANNNAGTSIPLIWYDNNAASQRVVMNGVWDGSNRGGFNFTHGQGSTGVSMLFNNPSNQTVGGSTLTINETFNPTSGTAFRIFTNITPTINQTGGANGITYGIRVNPTLTAAADWRSIEWSNNSGWGLYGAGTANNYLRGNTGINTTTIVDAGLTINQSVNGTNVLLSLRNDAGNTDNEVSLKMVAGNATVGEFGTILTHKRIGTGGAAFIIKTNATLGGTPIEALRVTQSQNLHLGTFSSDSGEKLQVNGTAKITGATSIVGNLTNTNSNFQTFGSTDYAASTWAMSIGNGGVSSNFYKANNQYFQNSTGVTGFEMTSNGTLCQFSSFGTTSFAASTWGIVIGNGLGSSNFYKANAHNFQNGSGTASLTINSAGAVTIPSNLTVDTDTFFVDAGSNRVGIGTISATAKLHVLGSLGAFRVLDSGAEVHFSRDGNNDFLANGGTAAQLTIGANTNIIFKSGTGLPERMRIDATGNVGIGNNAPSYRLQVETTNATAYDPSNTLTALPIGWLYNNSTTAGVAGTLRLDAGVSGGNAVATISAVHVGSGSSALTFGTRNAGGNTTERMRLDASGNLGLGVTPSAWGGVFRAMQITLGASISGQSNSQSTVHIAGNTYWDSSNVARYIGNEPAQRYRGSLGAHEWYTAPSGTLGNAITFTQAMTLDASGNLQIGQTTDTYNEASRVVVGINGATNSFISMRGGGTSFGYIFASSAALDINANSRPLTFSTTGTEKGRFFNNGNFSIGSTTDSGEKLQVNGTAKITGASTLSGGVTLGHTGGVAITYPSGQAIRSVGGIFVDYGNGGTGDLVFRRGSGVLNTLILAVSDGAATFSSSVQVGGGTINASAILQADSTTKGFLPPRMTTTQKNAIATPAAGLVVYDTTLNKLCVYTTAWETITSL